MAPSKNTSGWWWCITLTSTSISASYSRGRWQAYAALLAAIDVIYRPASPQLEYKSKTTFNHNHLQGPQGLKKTREIRKLVCEPKWDKIVPNTIRPFRFFAKVLTLNATIKPNTITGGVTAKQNVSVNNNAL